MTTLNERLAAIRAREQAATEGPWRAMPGPDGRLFAIDSDADYITLHNTVPVADATFIAHARTDMPALIAAVEAVLAEHKRIALTGGAVVCSRCASWVEEDPVSHDWPCPTVRAVTEALGATE